MSTASIAETLIHRFCIETLPSMPVVLSPSPGMNFQRRSHGKSNMSQHDIQNDIILRESAFIADQLLKKLTPAKPVHHHTEVPPVRQNLPEAPTAQILSPKTSPMIQKPPPPQLSSTRARTHFNSLLVPLLKDSQMPEPFPIHALTVPGRHRAPRVRAFIDFLVEQFGPSA